MVQALSTNTFTVAKFVVSQDPTQGTHTTIASAISSASSGDIIFVREGTYTENLTLKAGVNIVGLPGDGAQGSVIIKGKCSYSSVGATAISSVQLQTNGDYFLEVTGASASVVNVYNCFFAITDNTGIHLTSTSASSLINIYYCTGDISGAAVTFCTHSGNGIIQMENSSIYASGGTTVASTITTSFINLFNCGLAFPFSTSGTGFLAAFYTVFNTNSVTALTTAGTGVSSFNSSYITTGTAVCIVVGAGTTVNCVLTSLGSTSVTTNVINGAGNLAYAKLVCIGTATTLGGGLALTVYTTLG